MDTGTSFGFVSGTQLIFSSKTGDGDYHSEINRENSLHWFEYQHLMIIEDSSTIIIDNASNHSTVVNKVATTVAKMADIEKWLTEYGIPFETTLIKAQLLNLVQM